MKQSEEWDHFYLALAKFVMHQRSKDTTKVGAVVVNWESQMEFFGFNGFVTGIEDLVERYEDRELKYKLVFHAECAALRKAGEYAKGGTLYLRTPFEEIKPCCDCMKHIIMAGIKEIVMYASPYPESERALRWKESNQISREMADEVGILWREINV